MCFFTAAPFPITKDILSWAVIEALNKHVEFGGRHRPLNCLTPHRVAIIVPYRDREIHLKIFLTNLHIFLQKQDIDYGLFLVELVRIEFQSDSALRELNQMIH